MISPQTNDHLPHGWDHKSFFLFSLWGYFSQLGSRLSICKPELARPLALGEDKVGEEILAAPGIRVIHVYMCEYEYYTVLYTYIRISLSLSIYIFIYIQTLCLFSIYTSQYILPSICGIPAVQTTSATCIPHSTV